MRGHHVFDATSKKSPIRSSEKSQPIDLIGIFLFDGYLIVVPSPQPRFGVWRTCP